MKTRSLLISGICLLLAGGVLTAKAADLSRNDQPIQIKSSELTTDSANRTATFIGKVSARQGDVTIYCDRMVIYYSDKEKEVEKVEAFGNVRIIQGNRTGLSGHAVYENKAGTIILDDNPIVYQGPDVVNGKVITYFLDTQNSQVTSAPDKPVMVIVHPTKKEKNDGSKP
jgi:lipopolysaccharide export system protein LptA